MATEMTRLSFPSEDQVPVAYRLSAPLDQTTYLVNGELREWDGANQEVLSPVCLAAGEEVSRYRIGSYPLLGEAEAAAVLEAACVAYGNGSGDWPTMPIEERIRRLEEFTLRMKETRAEVVKLLMWEIGKNLADSEKEFYRLHRNIEFEMCVRIHSIFYKP